jgi:hypothetical protein
MTSELRDGGQTRSDGALEAAARSELLITIASLMSLVDDST